MGLKIGLENKHMRKYLIAIILSALFFAPFARADQVGVNLVTPEVVQALDAVTYGIINGTTVTRAHIGIVWNGQVVFTKSYLVNTVNTHVQDWASVSKPATSLIALKLINEGIIDSWDDDVWKYSPEYRGWLPTQYPTLTVRHIARHRGGLPAGALYICDANPSYIPPYTSGGKLIIKDPPGSTYVYSSRGFSVLGDVIEDATGMSYRDLVHTYIRDPVSAPTISVRYHPRGDYIQDPPNTAWMTPSAYMRSNIVDFAKFAAGIVNHVYSTDAEDTMMRTERMWLTPPTGHSLCLYHTGNNGAPAMSFLIVDPVNDTAAVCLFGGTSEAAQTGLRSPWASGLITCINSFEDPTGTGNVSPTVTITVPSITPSSTYAETYTLSGTASDPDGTIASVKYTHNGGTSTNCTGTTSWSIPDLALVIGTNTVVVTATDNLGATNSKTVVINRLVVSEPISSPAPGYIFSVPTEALWQHHRKGTEAVVTCANQLPAFEGARFLHRQFYTGEVDACLGTQPTNVNSYNIMGMNSAYPTGAKNTVTFATALSSNTVVARFYFRVTGDWSSAQTGIDGGGGLNFIRLYGGSGTGANTACVVRGKNDAGSATPRLSIYNPSTLTESLYTPTVNWQDGTWHCITYKCVRNNDTNATGNVTITVWLDDWYKAGAGFSSTITVPNLNNNWVSMDIVSDWNGFSPVKDMGIDIDKIEVWNGDPADEPTPPLPPVVLSANVDYSGASLTIQLSEMCTGNSGFTLTATPAASLAYSSGTGMARVYSISRPIIKNESVYLNYASSGTVRSTELVPLAAFTNKTVINLSQYTLTPTYATPKLYGGRGFVLTTE